MSDAEDLAAKTVEAAIASSEYAVLPIDDLVPWDRNPRTGVEEAGAKLADGIAAVGVWGADVLVQKGSMRVIGGHTRLVSARRLGLRSVPCKILDVNDARATEMALLDNRAAEWAAWEPVGLRALLEDLDPSRRAAIGWTPTDVAALLADLEGGGSGAPSTPTLVDRFLVPPFSTLDVRQGYWTDRKRRWLDLGIQSEIGRGGALTLSSLSGRVPYYYRHKLAVEARLGREIPNREFESEHLVLPEGSGISSSGTSVFDPVVCELVSRWFCPPGGRILDPFAGGSVRGVVAGILGRDYVGVELRPEQVEANREQWTAMRPPATPSDFAVPLGRGRTIDVHSDHGVPGGTKRVAIESLLRGAWSASEKELVYASPAVGFAQVALAEACLAHRLRCRIFVAERKVLHPATLAAKLAGATIEQIPHGYLRNVQAKATRYVEADPEHRYLVPFGLDAREFEDAIVEHVRSTRRRAPREVWCAAGSGTLARAIQRAWPKAAVHAVVVGKRDSDLGRATRYVAEEAFDAPAVEPPPFPSNAHYDAKVWRFVEQHASDGALFWNVAGDAGVREPGDVSWIEGDSRKVLAALEEEVDLVFSCPPYADLELYSDDPADLSNMPWEGFLEAYREIVRLSIARLRPNRFAAFVVGEVRDKRSGLYRNLVGETVRAFEDAGARFYNEAILVLPVGSVPIRVGRQFESGRKLGKTHANLLVFVKGDSRIAAAASPLDIDPEALSSGESDADPADLTDE